MSQDDDLLRLNASLDGEIDVDGSMAFERRLASDPRLQAEWARQRALRSAIREQATYFEMPAPLLMRIKQTAGARPQSGTPTQSPGRGDAAVLTNEGRRRWAVAAAGVLLGAVFSAGLTWRIIEQGSTRANSEQRIAEDAVAGHIRAIMTDRVVDVANSDQHTVKPWLTARLPYAPPVPDLSAHGFDLAGARRDVIDGQVVGVLVYRRRQHTISAFIGPIVGNASSGSIQNRSIRGFNLVEVDRGPMRYWVVSDLNARDLGDFAELLVTGR